MRIESIIHNGIGYSHMTPEELAEAGVPESVIADAVAELTANATREATRARIAATAGDIPSLLGTTADVAALGLLGAMQLLIIIAENGTEAMKAALKAAPIPMPVEKAKALLAAITSGQVKVPALMKGIDAVYADVAARATATADAMVAPKG